MLKYLLLIGLAVVFWSNWKKRARSRGGLPPREMPPQQMVACAFCGLHLPLAESLAEGDRYYCCEAHRESGAQLPSP